jgi:protein-tyrosine-phosphatase
LTMTALRELSRLTILFVCTGNTCRSPMAQALMEKKVQERFGHLAVDGVIPIVVKSAGVSAFGDDPASHGAQQAIRKFGISLDSHHSSQLNSELVEQSDIILAMGNRHRHVIISQWPSLASKVNLISPDGGEISDPFGGPVEVYEQCARQLDQHTSYWLDQLDTSALIQWR